MQMQDARVIAAPQEEVWAALMDAQILQSCVPGCQRMSGSAEDGFEARVVQKVGPVKATFTGRITLQDIVAHESCTIVGEGKGGAAGFAKGSAHLVLSTQDGDTHLAYEVEAKIGGKLAQLGSRIIDGFAKKVADEFFMKFQQVIEGGNGHDESDVAG